MPDRSVDDKPARQRVIGRSVLYTVPLTLLAVGAAYALLPPLHGLEETSARLVLALRWLVVAMLPYAAVCLHISTARFFEGSHNPLAGTESERLKIHCRVMQNTLEQLVWFAICVLAFATLVGPAEARLVPILCVSFAIARVVYWWGYLRAGTLGRAPGVQLTFSLNIPLLLVVLVLLGRSLVL